MIEKEICPGVGLEKKKKESKARKKTRPGEIRRKTDSRERMKDSKITRQRQPIPCSEDK